MQDLTPFLDPVLGHIHGRQVAGEREEFYQRLDAAHQIKGP